MSEQCPDPLRPDSTPDQGGYPDSITDLIAAQAEREPNRVAIAWSGGDPWKYSELMGKADAIAHHLLERGVARGELVGVYMPRRPEMVAAVLGILRAGAAYVPFEPKFPAARLAYISDHTSIRHLLVWLATEVPDVLLSRTTTLELCELEAESTHARQLPTPSRNDLAYVLYTSGSTGRPKGVRILQRNLINDLLSLQREPGISASDVMGAFTNLSFDPSVHEIFLPLMVGASIVIATEIEQTEPAAATRLMRELPMTMLQSSPIMLRLMLDNGRSDELRNMKLWVGGEAMPRELAEAVLPKCGELWNMYGPTEATVEATIHRVSHGTGPIPIGKPIDHTFVYLLDETGKPVEKDELGEIWIGGAGVADGYLGDPERTAERFLPDTFASDGSRMYRTGDLGRLRDGLLYFHGRVDDQINLHGARIEPGEIESAALAVPGIHQAVVVARNIDDELCLVLYVVADADPDRVTQLRVSLRTSLPVFMLPRYVVRLATLPATPNGKVDRKALPPPKTPPKCGAPESTRQSTVAAAGRLSFVNQSSVATGSNDEQALLVPIQPHGQNTPLFLIHDIDGQVSKYVPLARGLGADQPVYGVQAFGLDGLIPPVDSIPTIAACYVAEIQRLQSHGPYLLGGSSMGGLIAFEMARQLREQREQIGLLALICAPPSFDKAISTHRSIVRSCLRVLWRVLDARRVQRARITNRALPGALRQRELARAHERAIRDYDIRPYLGPAVLFKVPRQPDAAVDAKDVGWANHVAGTMRTIEIPGTSETLLEQPELLRALRGLLKGIHQYAATECDALGPD